MTFTGQPRILITGAHGFVGRHLVTRLLELMPAGGELVLVDAHAGAQQTHCRTYIADITNAAQVADVVHAEQPTHLIHLAAIAAVTEATADTRKAWSVNFGGTQNLALAVAEHAPGCRFVFCSSAEVYGASFIGSGRCDETALLQPVNAYGAAKAAADIMLGQMARHDLKVIRLRPFNHTGPGQNVQFVAPAFAAQVARIERGEQEPVIQVGDLSSARDFLDVRDVVDAYAAALMTFDAIPNGSVMNIASGEARVVRTILDDLLAMSNIKIDVVVDQARLRPSDMPVIAGEAALARKLLDWKPRHAWADTLKSVLAFWRAQPKS